MGFLWSQLFVTPKCPTTSFAGQTVIVTGSNVGLGKEAARHFARLGASTVILACRNLEAGDAAKKDIEKTTECSPDVIEVWHLDLANFSSVKKFAARASSLERVDVLTENAAIATGKFRIVEGYERTITVNVLGTFLLALLMLPKLKSDAKRLGIAPRLTLVVSEVHAWAKFPERSADMIMAKMSEGTENLAERYPASKLLEVLLVRHLASKMAGSGVVLNMLNPGLCHSELGREGSLGLEVLKFFFARTTEVGSRTLVAAAVAGAGSHGKYMTDGRVADDAVSPFARSEEGAQVGQKLWAELIGILTHAQPGIEENV